MAIDVGGVWFVLMMNDLRAAQIEILRPVARARLFETLEGLLEAERVPPYRDERWGKVFRRGGPFEWKNDPARERFGGIEQVYAVAVAGDVTLVTTDALARIPTAADLTAGERRAVEASLAAQAFGAVAEAEAAEAEAVAALMEEHYGPEDLEAFAETERASEVPGAKRASLRLVDPTPAELESEGPGVWSQCERCGARTRVPLPADLEEVVPALRRVIDAHRSCDVAAAAARDVADRVLGPEGAGPGVVAAGERAEGGRGKS